VRLLRQVTAGCLACLALALALRPPPAPANEPATVPVVTAADDLSPGTVLGAGDLAAVDVPAALAPAGSAADPGELAGRVLASPVRAGEVVTDVRVVGPGLWSQVPAGQVAAPVRLADLAVATLLRAGDRVDVLGTTAAAGSSAPAVELVAHDALVLSAPAAEPGAAAGAGTDSGLLVLAVLPDTARQLAASGAGGTLTVTLGRP
jgi:Flp pilus assembly protein CpaB